MASDANIALLKQLKNPFDPKFLKWRVGATNKDKTKGIALPYLDAREIMKRLDEVMGVGGWQDRLIRADKGFICELGLFINDQWIWKSNAGEDSNMSPLKGGASDAIKRSATLWGVGRYLYYLPAIWVDIKQVGTSKDGKPTYGLANTPELPEWALPGMVENWEDIAELESDTIGADPLEVVDVVITHIDNIRGAKTVEAFDQVIKAMPADEKLLLANEIQAKKRELAHDSKIHTDNS